MYYTVASLSLTKEDPPCFNHVVGPCSICGVFLFPFYFDMSCIAMLNQSYSCLYMSILFCDSMLIHYMMFV